MVRPASPSAGTAAELTLVDAGQTVVIPLPARHRPRHRHPSNLIRNILIVIIVAATSTLVGMGIGAYKAYYGGQAETNQEQQVLQKQFQAGIGPALKSEGPEPIPGAAYAKLTIPVMNKSWIVVQGTDLKDIAHAPGHWLGEGTTAPGKVGNFSVAGHRSAAIFGDLDRVKVGAVILVQTHTSLFTYKVTSTEIVPAADLSVFAATPDHFGVKPTKKMMTLYSCEPWYSTANKLVVHAQLVAQEKV